MIKNSLKFTQEGSIFYTAMYDPFKEMLEVKVMDTGVGIEESQRGMIFDSYGKRTLYPELNQDGIGLGLKICKQIVEYYNGTIDFSSQGKDQGSIFTFSMHMKASKSFAIDQLKQEPLSFAKLELFSDFTSNPRNADDMEEVVEARDESIVNRYSPKQTQEEGVTPRQMIRSLKIDEQDKSYEGASASANKGPRKDL